jgi:hypothetical protein
MAAAAHGATTAFTDNEIEAMKTQLRNFKTQIEFYNATATTDARVRDAVVKAPSEAKLAKTPFPVFARRVLDTIGPFATKGAEEPLGLPSLAIFDLLKANYERLLVQYTLGNDEPTHINIFAYSNFINQAQIGANEAAKLLSDSKAHAAAEQLAKAKKSGATAQSSGSGGSKQQPPHELETMNSNSGFLKKRIPRYAENVKRLLDGIIVDWVTMKRHIRPLTPEGGANDEEEEDAEDDDEADAATKSKRKDKKKKKKKRAPKVARGVRFVDKVVPQKYFYPSLVDSLQLLVIVSKQIASQGGLYALQTEVIHGFENALSTLESYANILENELEDNSQLEGKYIRLKIAENIFKATHATVVLCNLARDANGFDIVRLPKPFSEFLSTGGTEDEALSGAVANAAGPNSSSGGHQIQIAWESKKHASSASAASAASSAAHKKPLALYIATDFKTHLLHELDRAQHRLDTVLPIRVAHVLDAASTVRPHVLEALRGCVATVRAALSTAAHTAPAPLDRIFLAALHRLDRDVHAAGDTNAKKIAVALRLCFAAFHNLKNAAHSVHTTTGAQVVARQITAAAAE